MALMIAKLRELLDYMNKSWDRDQDFQVLVHPAEKGMELYRGFALTAHRKSKQAREKEKENLERAVDAQKSDEEFILKYLLPEIEVLKQDAAGLRSSDPRRKALIEEIAKKEADVNRKREFWRKYVEDNRERTKEFLIPEMSQRANSFVSTLMATGSAFVRTVTSTSYSKYTASFFSNVGVKNTKFISDDTVYNWELVRRRFIFVIQVPEGFPIIDTQKILVDFRRAQRMRFQEKEVLLLPHLFGKTLRFELVQTVTNRDPSVLFKEFAQANASLILGSQKRLLSAEEGRRAMDFTLLILRPSYVVDDSVDDSVPPVPDEIEQIRMVVEEELADLAAAGAAGGGAAGAARDDETMEDEEEEGNGFKFTAKATEKPGPVSLARAQGLKNDTSTSLFEACCIS